MVAAAEFPASGPPPGTLVPRTRRRFPGIAARASTRRRPGAGHADGGHVAGVDPAGGHQVRRRLRPGRKAAAGERARAWCRAIPGRCCWRLRGVLAISLIKIALHIWGRWHATRVTKLIQMSVRKRVFAHAVRLPLHRVQELKSGGAASILRQDAGSVGDLVFGMLYNPWRAVIQLAGQPVHPGLGRLAAAARGAGRLFRWSISRIAPGSAAFGRSIAASAPSERRSTRLATESFGGMRVVRAFGRQRSETNRIMRGNHLMGRQELYAWWWMRAIEIVWETLIPLATRGAAALRRLASAARAADAGRSDDVPGLPADAAGAAGRAGPERRPVPEQPVRPRPRARSARRTARDGSRPAAARWISQRTSPAGSRSTASRSAIPASDAFALQDISLDVEPGRNDRAGRTQRRGQDDALQSGRAVLRSDQRPRAARRSRLRDIDVESYRSLIGIVEQDVFLFDGTVAENIAYGNRHATDDEIRRAAEIANADEFIATCPTATTR